MIFSKNNSLKVQNKVKCTSQNTKHKMKIFILWLAITDVNIIYNIPNYFRNRQKYNSMYRKNYSARHKPNTPLHVIKLFKQVKIWGMREIWKNQKLKRGTHRTVQKTIVPSIKKDIKHVEIHMVIQTYVRNICWDFEGKQDHSTQTKYWRKKKIRFYLSVFQSKLFLLNYLMLPDLFRFSHK